MFISLRKPRLGWETPHEDLNAGRKQNPREKLGFGSDFAPNCLAPNLLVSRARHLIRPKFEKFGTAQNAGSEGLSSSRKGTTLFRGGMGVR